MTTTIAESQNQETQKALPTRKLKPLVCSECGHKRTRFYTKPFSQLPQEKVVKIRAESLARYYRKKAETENARHAQQESQAVDSDKSVMPVSKEQSENAPSAEEKHSTLGDSAVNAHQQSAANVRSRRRLKLVTQYASNAL